MKARRRHWALRLGAALALTLLAVAWLLQPALRQGTLELIMSKVRTDFPSVPQISTEELATRLESGESLVLLDVRRPEEFAVSRLPGALRVDPGDPSPPALDAIPPGAAIVAYCSVGYRSSALVEALQRHGYKKVVNLEGSLFRWAEEDRPLENDQGPTHQVHPYSRAWAFLVVAERRSYRPPNP